MNRCLHRRFSNMANKLGCASYWIDTLCIPEDHELRREAIKFINRIFSTSRCMVILDKDVMEMKVSEPHNVTVSEAERILTVLLCSDWNMRAWTMMEADRGHQGTTNVYLACAGDELISLRQVVNLVVDQRMEFSRLIHSAHHLLPTDERPTTSHEKYSIEGASNLLSHRHASRPDDDVVIWSLLIAKDGGKIHFNAKDSWMDAATKRKKINSAFLISRAPRLNLDTGICRFSWAPATPYSRDPEHIDHVDRGDGFLPSDGAGSMKVTVTKQGLEGIWYVYDVPEGETAPACLPSLGGGTNLPAQRLRRLLRPTEAHLKRPYEGYINRDENKKLRVAIVGGDRLNGAWYWYGVGEISSAAGKWRRIKMRIV